MTHQTYAEQREVLGVSRDSMQLFIAHASDPQVVARAKAEHDAKAGGVNHVAQRDVHGPNGFER